MLSDLEFENLIKDLGENQLELIKFVARQQYGTNKLLLSHDERIKAIEHQGKKMFGLTGGIGAVIGAGITSTLDYFFRR